MTRCDATLKTLLLTNRALYRRRMPGLSISAGRHISTELAGVATYSSLSDIFWPSLNANRGIASPSACGEHPLMNGHHT